ncbi:cold-shock protein [Mesorhizobium sp. 10J20-29]
MGKYRDHRQPRGLRFEKIETADAEPSYFRQRSSSQQQTAPSQNAMQGGEDVTLLWFNADKGFGFVKSRDGSTAFLHGTKLRAAGYNDLPSGAVLNVRIESGHKGMQVIEVLRSAKPPARPIDGHKTRPQDAEEREGTGVVKRYDAIKGFGFVTLEEGDAFVHSTTLTLCGIATLESGQSVFVSYGQGRKGLEVRRIRLN